MSPCFSPNFRIHSCLKLSSPYSCSVIVNKMIKLAEIEVEKGKNKRSGKGGKGRNFRNEVILETERWMNDVLLTQFLKTTKEVVSRASARGVLVLLTVLAEKKPEIFCGYLVEMSDTRGQLVVQEGTQFSRRNNFNSDIRETLGLRDADLVTRCNRLFQQVKDIKSKPEDSLNTREIRSLIYYNWTGITLLLLVQVKWNYIKVDGVEVPKECLLTKVSCWKK